MQWQGCGQRCRQGVSQGEGWVEGYCPLQRAWTLRLDGVPMLLGFWWIMVSGQLRNNHIVERSEFFNFNIDVHEYI